MIGQKAETLADLAGFAIDVNLVTLATKAWNFGRTHLLFVSELLALIHRLCQRLLKRLYFVLLLLNIRLHFSDHVLFLLLIHLTLRKLISETFMQLVVLLFQIFQLEFLISLFLSDVCKLCL